MWFLLRNAWKGLTEMSEDKCEPDKIVDLLANNYSEPDMFCLLRNALEVRMPALAKKVRKLQNIYKSDLVGRREDVDILFNKRKDANIKGFYFVDFIRQNRCYRYSAMF